MVELFFRSGERFQGVPHIDGTKATVTLLRSCSRCGGAGWDNYPNDPTFVAAQDLVHGTGVSFGAYGEG